MSEAVYTEEVATEEVTEQKFGNVGSFVQFLEEGTEDEMVSKEWVVATLKDIMSRPSKSGVRRGKLAGLTLEEMDDEQLKRELINSKSVLYKAEKRGASEETIAKNQARVDAATAEKEKRDATKKAEEPAEEADQAETNDEVEAEL